MNIYASKDSSSEKITWNLFKGIYAIILKSMLDTLAIENLKLLGESKDIREFRLMVDGCRIHRIESPNYEYDPMLSLKELSYPVLFSFYRTFQIIETSDDRTQKEDYMRLMDLSLDNLYYLINQSEEDIEVRTSFKMIVNDLEYSYSELDERYMRQSSCEKMFSSFEEYFNKYLNTLVGLFENSRKYLYLTPMTTDLDEDDTSDSEGDIREPPDSSDLSDLSDSSDPDRDTTKED
jgi:hypothetical protein